MQRVPLYTKAAFGLGQFAEGAKNASFNVFLLFYFSSVLGLPGTWTGIALFLAMAFDAITDPITGSISDRLRHRWGRRHPFMYASALPLGVTFSLLFSPPPGLGERGLFLWLLTFAVLVRSSMTLYHVPHLALGAELSDDYSERTTIVAFRTFFGFLGMATAVASAWLFFFRPTPEYETGQLNPSVYPAYGLLFGAAMTFTILASAVGTHDRIPQLPRPPRDAPPFRAADVLGDYAGALRNASFRSFFIGIVIFFVMRGIQEVLQVHMGTYFWGLDPQEIFQTSAGAIVGFLAGLPFWTSVSSRLDKKPTFLIGVVGFSFCVLSPPIAKIAGLFPPQESASYLGTLIAASFVGSFSAAAAIVTAGSMLADLTDEHELDTGRRQEGVFFGALAFAGKSSSGLGTFLAGLGLDVIDFPRQAEPGSVDPETVTALGILYGPGIAVLAVLALVFLTRYRIDRHRYEEISAQLGRQREAPPVPP